MSELHESSVEKIETQAVTPLTQDQVKSLLLIGGTRALMKELFETNK